MSPSNAMRARYTIHEEPVFVNEKRYLKAIPQYEMGHIEKNRQIEDFMSKNRGIYIAGNFMDGVSGSHCVRRGHQVSKRIAIDLSTSV